MKTNKQTNKNRKAKPLDHTGAQGSQEERLLLTTTSRGKCLHFGRVFGGRWGEGVSVSKKRKSRD
jgi:lipid-binding SYLF domain-containing protein